MRNDEIAKLKILCKDAPQVNVAVIILSVLASICFLCYLGIVISIWVTSHRRQVASEERLDEMRRELEF